MDVPVTKCPEKGKVEPSTFFTQVKEAAGANVPFVSVTGGHSPWSTIENGIIIDLCNYREVEVAAAQHTVTVRGGVLTKELQLALTEYGQFTSTTSARKSSKTMLTVPSGSEWQHCWHDTLLHRRWHKFLYAPCWLRL